MTNYTKGLVFIISVTYGAFLVFGAAMLLAAGDPDPLVGFLISAPLLLLGWGLARLAAWLFPADRP